MRIDILTIFPEMFQSVLSVSIPGRAQESGAVEIHTTDIRDFSDDEKHRKVDDRPFGGGPGMVMACQPIWEAVRSVEKNDDRLATRILMTPQGRSLNQSMVEDLAGKERLLIIAGRYEGIDERVIEKLNPLELSIGDYVLSGGELPAMVLVDAVTRLLPGVLGDSNSAAEDSFSKREEDGQNRLLDCPHYTRPRVWNNMEVPGILLSGDHAEIAKWREEQRTKRTKTRRPDLKIIDETDESDND